LHHDRGIGSDDMASYTPVIVGLHSMYNL